jgi:hypothetical protein
MDFRDVLVTLAPYHDCARRLGLDPAALFREVAVDLPNSVAELAQTFGGRIDVTLAAFGWRLDNSPLGPIYHFSGSTAQNQDSWPSN